MSAFRQISQTRDGIVVPGGRAHPAVEQKRRAIRSSVLGAGTLACPRCDAPIAPGDRSLLLTDSLACPFCDLHGPARNFLSLSASPRPARVVLRVAARPG